MKLVNEILIVFVLIHGLIHLLGFAKASKLVELNQFSMEVSPFYGFLWGIASLLFIFSGVLLLLNSWIWAFALGTSLIMSQFLIFKFWNDAKVGSIANILIGIAFAVSLSVK